MNGDGHIFNSRAQETDIQNVHLLGEKGFQSRSIDFSCGGKFRVTDSVIQQGDNTDNPDMIAVGTERKNCGKIRPSDVSITNSWIIFDRDRSADERSRNYGPNFLCRWHAPMVSVDLHSNHILNLDRWSMSNAEKHEVTTIPVQSAPNTVRRDQKACSLSKNEVPTP